MESMPVISEMEVLVELIVSEIVVLVEFKASMIDELKSGAISPRVLFTISPMISVKD